jgi:predicted phage tail protein
MSRKQIIGYVLLSLIVIAALAVGGYALYHLGYSHGLRGVSQLSFEKRAIPDFHHRMLPDLRNYRWHIGFPLFAAFPGLLFGLGVIALVVLAVIGIVKILQPNKRAKEQSQSEEISSGVSDDKDSPSTQ